AGPSASALEYTCALRRDLALALAKAGTPARSRCGARRLAILARAAGASCLVYALRTNREARGHSFRCVTFDEFGSGFRNHIDRVTRALLEARRTPGAQ